MKSYHFSMFLCDIKITIIIIIIIIINISQLKNNK